MPFQLRVKSHDHKNIRLAQNSYSDYNYAYFIITLELDLQTFYNHFKLPKQHPGAFWSIGATLPVSANYGANPAPITAKGNIATRRVFKLIPTQNYPWISPVFHSCSPLGARLTGGLKYTRIEHPNVLCSSAAQGTAFDEERCGA